MFYEFIYTFLIVTYKVFMLTSLNVSSSRNPIAYLLSDCIQPHCFVLAAFLPLYLKHAINSHWQL